MLKIDLITAIIIGLVPASVSAVVNNTESRGLTEQNLHQDHSLIGKNGSHDSKAVNLDRPAKYVLEVKTMDEPDLMTWDAAVNAVKKHGPGWRLPTIAELRIMYEQRIPIGGDPHRQKRTDQETSDCLKLASTSIGLLKPLVECNLTRFQVISALS
jgi:hypothetical protein